MMPKKEVKKREAQQIAKKIKRETAKPNKRGGKRPGAGRPKGSTQLAPQDDRLAFAKMCRSRSPKVMAHVDRLLALEKLDAGTLVSIARYLSEYGFGRPPQIHDDPGKADVDMINALAMLVKAGAHLLSEKELDNLDCIVRKLAGTEGTAPSREVSKEVRADKFATTVGYTGRG